MELRAGTPTPLHPPPAPCENIRLEPALPLATDNIICRGAHVHVRSAHRPRRCGAPMCQCGLAIDLPRVREFGAGIRMKMAETARTGRLQSQGGPADFTPKREDFVKLIRPRSMHL